MTPDFIARPLDLLLGYEPGMPLPTVSDQTQTQWHPEDALAMDDPRTSRNQARLMNGRTANEDIWTLWRRRHVAGIREGLAKVRMRKQVADHARLLKAKVVVDKLQSIGVIDLSDIEYDADKARAEDAIVVLVSIAHDGNARATDRIGAAKAILDFTRAKPAAKAEIKVSPALSWLDEAEAEANRLLDKP